MITDVPKITQRSIIAYSAVEGNPLPGDWYGCAVRRSFGVDSLTAATVRIVSGENRVTTYVFDTNCRAVVNGTSVNIQCKFTSTDSPGVSYGVEGHGTFTVEVTTAGDANAGIAGATAQFTVKVLVLEFDMPYGAPNFLSFAVGESVDAALGASKLARGDWITKEVGTGYGLSASGGQRIVGNTQINGEYVDSGVILHNRDGALSISGTAARPGVYRVFFDLLSTVQGFGEGSQVYHPFEGGYGESEVIIWIYRDWLPGDLVLLLPARTEAGGRYALKFDRAPSWAGLGDELIGVELRREVNGEVVTWRGAKLYYHGDAVSSAYHYLIRRVGGTWQLYGKFIDSDTPPAVADMTLLATASALGFDDETPPKYGWSENSLMATGDARWYLPPESGQTDNSGWYSYAGTVTLTPPGEGAEPVTVEVYARQPHVIPQYAGWDLGTTTGTEARYIVYVGGTWHVTATLADVSNWSAITAAPTVEPQDATGNVAVPFCPAKLGDVGLAVEVPPPEGSNAEPATVLHSLSNCFAGTGDLALFMDGVAGAMWRRYPMRRLLSLFSVGATVSMSISSSKRITEYSEAHNPDGLMPEYNDSADYPGGAPTVAQIKAAGGSITISTVENWEKLQLEISASAGGSVSFSLAYALWSDTFPKYLDAILGRSSSASGITASYSHDRVASGKQASSIKTYRVGETEGGGGGGDPTPHQWYISEASIEYIRETWTEVPGEEPELADRSIRRVAYTDAGGWGDPEIIGTPEEVFKTMSVNNYGVVSISASVSNAGIQRISIAASGYRSANASDTQSGDHVDDDPDNPNIIYRVLTMTATATYSGDPGPDPDPGTEEVAYLADESLSGTAYTTVGNATTSTGSSKTAHGTATVYFGEGRECDWRHRSVCAAAGGEGGMSVDFSATNQQRQVQTTTTTGGQRRRSGPRDQWEYVSGNEQTWGTTTVTTETDEDLPETLTDSLAHGGTFHTGVIALIFAAAMGSLSATYSTTDGYATGSAFGHRKNPQTGENESANIPTVEGTWTHISASSTAGPDTSETRGTDVSGSVDLSGELGDDWEQWGYSYHKSTRTTRLSVQIAITDSDASA